MGHSLNNLRTVAITAAISKLSQTKTDHRSKRKRAETEESAKESAQAARLALRAITIAERGAVDSVLPDRESRCRG